MKTITPKEFETLFHIVSNQKVEVDGVRYAFLDDLASKLAARGTTARGLNPSSISSGTPQDYQNHRYLESLKARLSRCEDDMIAKALQSKIYVMKDVMKEIEVTAQ